MSDLHHRHLSIAIPVRFPKVETPRQSVKQVSKKVVVLICSIDRQSSAVLDPTWPIIVSPLLYNLDLLLDQAPLRRKADPLEASLDRQWARRSQSASDMYELIRV
jgi:hypothetical protein